MFISLPSSAGSLPTPQPIRAVASLTDLEIAAQNRTVSAAYKLLRESGAAGISHEFTISIDPATRQAVVKVVDLITKKVVEQFPTELLLQVARQLNEGITQQSLRAADKTLTL